MSIIFYILSSRELNEEKNTYFLCVKLFMTNMCTTGFIFITRYKFSYYREVECIMGQMIGLLDAVKLVIESFNFIFSVLNFF